MLKIKLRTVPIFMKRNILLLIMLAAACALASGCSPRVKPRVYINKLESGDYQLMVEGKSYVVNGVCYNPIPIGSGYDYDWWMDPNSPWLVDGKLMQEMGVNTIRLYKSGENNEQVKKVIGDLYEKYGIRTIMGHWLGFWDYPCPLYADKGFQEKIKKQVLNMVNTYKDEPGILLWILGNENNYSCFGKGSSWSSKEIEAEPDPQKRNYLRAKTYYSFVNELAGEIHKIDPNHPVALGNGELVGLDIADEVSPDIDIVACIIYRGRSFGNLFNSLRNTFDRPMLLSEFGADSYDSYMKRDDEDMQAFFLESQWCDIYRNLAGNGKGAGNCVGGTLFEWSDEWWKHNESSVEGWKVHDTESFWSNGSYYFDIKVEGNMNMNEEYFGIVGLSEELENGLNKRIPKKSYYAIKEFWNDPQDKPRHTVKPGYTEEAGSSLN